MTTNSTSAEQSLLQAILANTEKPLSDNQKTFASKLAVIRPNGSFRLSQPDSKWANHAECSFRFIIKHNDKTINVVMEITESNNNQIMLQSTRVGYRGEKHYERYNYSFNHYNTHTMVTKATVDGDITYAFEKFEKSVIHNLEQTILKEERAAQAKAVRQAALDAKNAKLKAELFSEHGLVSNAKTELGFTIALKSGSLSRVKATFKEMLPLLA
jgi:hypothetical protein